MTYKLYIKSITLFFILVISFTCINTLLYYFDIINKYTSNIISIISIMLPSIITGIYIGIKSKNKAYINSLTSSLVITIISLLLKILITRNINIGFLLIYITISLLLTISSIITINKKGNSN